jgi:predicted molibdopterin-dependent oxidoreductase YjgC
LEKDGTFTNFEGRVQRLRAVTKPPGEAWPESRIIQELSGRLGYPMAYASAAAIMEEIRGLVPAYGSIAYADLELRGHVWVGWGEERSRSGQVRFDGRPGRFQSVHQPALPQPEEGYPLQLLTGSTLYHSGTGTQTSRAWRLKKFSPRASLDLSSADADKHHIADGDRVNVVSKAGRLTVAAHISDRVPQGVCFLPDSYPDTPINALLEPAPGQKVPGLNSCAVRLEKVEGNG